MILTGCSARIYTTGTNMDPVTQLPVSVKEKGDLSLDGSISIYDAGNSSAYSYILGKEVQYRFLSLTECSLGGHYALNKYFSMGLRYKYGGGHEKYKGHSILASANFFQNRPTKRGKAVYGYDVLGSAQLKTAHNFMTVDEYFLRYYSGIIGDDEYWGITTSGFQKLSYYRIRQNYFRLSLQPSFSVEHRLVSFFIGIGLAYQDQFKYKTTLNIDFVEYQKEIDVGDPLVYYATHRHAFIWETFWGLGVGPDFCRVVMKVGMGSSTDAYQNSLGNFAMGITSNLNIKKIKQGDPIF